MVCRSPSPAPLRMRNPCSGFSQERLPLARAPASSGRAVLPGQPLGQRLPVSRGNPIFDLRLTQGCVYAVVQGIPQWILLLIHIDQDFASTFEVDVHDGDAAPFLFQGDEGIFIIGMSGRLAGRTMLWSQSNDPLRGLSLPLPLMPRSAWWSSYARPPVLCLLKAPAQLATVVGVILCVRTA